MFSILLQIGLGLASTAVWLVFTAFWIWMIVECLTKETGNDRLVWIIVLVFVPYCGALIYYLVRRPERIRLYGDWQRD
jgi:hypothetical protein